MTALRGSHFVLSPLVLALAMVGRTAAAQPAGDEAAARAAFDEGKAFRDKGDWEHACPKFKEAHTLFPTGGTALSFADCEERAGRLKEARALYQLIIDNPANQSNPERVKVASEHLASIDKLLAEQEKAKTPVAPPPPKETPKEEPPRMNPVPGAVLLGAGGAILVVGGALGGVALSEASDVKKTCTNNVCPANQKDAADGAKTKALVADVAFGVGAAAAVTGVVLLFVIKTKPTPKPAAAYSVEPTATGFLVRF